MRTRRPILSRLCAPRVGVETWGTVVGFRVEWGNWNEGMAMRSALVCQSRRTHRVGTSRSTLLWSACGMVTRAFTAPGQARPSVTYASTRNATQA